ncbi:hypothetical protein WR25_16073 [Diploscapter pachys]|uniref:Uncharacterized protein n=1 Tax=Diploscapter pachys TaxID=2018661 RepID=A0A2A2KJ59_9BILA|nr:hypothetical protein WR25_16073 [Diploscapter pachys]
MATDLLSLIKTEQTQNIEWTHDGIGWRPRSTGPPVLTETKKSNSNKAGLSKSWIAGQTLSKSEPNSRPCRSQSVPDFFQPPDWLPSYEYLLEFWLKVREF